MRSVFSAATQSCIYPCGDPSWVQYDEQIISNLDLPFQVVWTGSEDALLAEVSSAYSRQEPVLFYFYSPHAIFQQFDLSQVELPAYSDELLRRSGRD